jgi:hypothetical protein
METIVFAGVIIALAGVAIWSYNRGAKSLDVNNDGKVDLDDAKQAVANTTQGIVEDTRDARDLALSLASESAARATVALEKIKKPRAAAAKKPAKTTKPAKTSAAKTSKPRATKSSK